MVTHQGISNKFNQTLARLTEVSTNEYYNPYQVFQWPETLPENQYWMSLDLMSVYDTPFTEQLSEAQLMALSKWESINFYSLNIHGIRELLIEVVKRIHTNGFEIPSEFLHHIVGEENEHMWFFSKFCLNYGKIYRNKKIISEGFAEPDIESFIVFTRILIFEEIVDYFNARMGKDETLHPTIANMNRIHHRDESRHINFGREIVNFLHSQIRKRYSSEKLGEIEDYIKRYIATSIHSLYNPNAYRDAGIPDAYNFRTELLKCPSRKPHHYKMLKRSLNFLVKHEILSNEELAV